MKLLYVTREAPYGDNEGFILPEIDSHIQAGWDVFVCPLDGRKLVHRIEQTVLDRTMTKLLISPSICAGAIAQFVRTPRLALDTLWKLVTHSRITLLPRNLAVWPKGLWLGRQVRLLNIQHIHAHWIAVPATMGFIAASVAEVPFSITAHRYDIAQGNLIPTKFEAASFVRAIDEGGASELAMQARSDQRRPIILRMGVNIPDQPAPSPPDGVFRGVVGARLAEKKGYGYLLEAVAIAKQQGLAVHIDAFGDGPLEAELRRKADKLGISELVTWQGSVGHETLLERIRSGDYHFGVLPSVTARDGDKEGIPVFLMEAMAAGLPVISTPNGGIRELVAPGTGILVEERDSDAIAAAMVRLARNPSERRAMGTAARDRIITDFSIEARMNQLRSLISKSVTSGPPYRQPVPETQQDFRKVIV
ncbi:glycosyltransferase [Microvirga lotononidis]|uniref:Glycosyltransferase n=1 Tax=Microvirga lotononidis TaxID=864069 RepID=I4YY92_9HYPH|nr:glycosyltransferase [Microvirga lotononidis]EIM28934.1 glycosyltransferase [Microvirga lotononidis]WQO26852.1 glycosyltransferase [Microvirga lotononidis]